MLVSPGGKVKGVAYLIGSMTSTAIVGGVLLAVGVGSGTSSDGGPSTAASLLKLVLGVVLLGLAARQWRGRPLAGEKAVMPGWMGALDGFTPLKALAAGVILNVFNSKNLLFIVGGAAAVAGAGASGSQEAVAWAVFCVIATIGVATPVVIVFATGDRSAEAARPTQDLDVAEQRRHHGRDLAHDRGKAGWRRDRRALAGAS